MPDYAYEALTANGAVTRGAMQAASEQELDARLRELGQYLIKAEQKRERAAEAAAASSRTDGAVPRQELLSFTEYLAGSVQAGIPILATLSDLELRLESKRMKRILAEVGRAMSEEGKGLSEALAEHPKAFSELYIGTIEAGEASGHLDFALQRLVEYLDWQQQVTTQLRQATMYPIMILVAVLALITILITFVYPRLMPVLTGFNVELPLATRVIMGIAVFVRGEWSKLLVGAAGLGAALWAARRTARGRRLLDRTVLHLPIFGPLVREINMARFVTYMALFYRTGVELIRGLMLVERMMDNVVVKEAVASARLSVTSGESLARSFERAKLFPPIVVRSIALGESTGNLDEALGRAKAYYDREVPAAVRKLLTALQPLLVLLLGFVITIVALSIFMPILNIYQSIGQ